MNARLALLLVAPVLLAPVPSSAHHGGVTLAFGPGTPVETASPLTLPEGGFVLALRTEHVDWKKRSFAQPNNKSSFTFFNANVSFGFTPAFMGTVIVPYYVKRQDGFGSNEGLSDLKLQFTYGFHHDPGKGFARNTSEDTAVTLEGRKRTYLSISAMMSLPTGDHRKELGGEVDPGMQPGFGAPAYTLGLAAARTVGPVTLNADTGFDFFTERDSFKFGTEWRMNLAGVYELYGKPKSFLSKLDGILELNYLQLARDEENGEGLEATGGRILYLSPGARFTFPSLSNANLGLAVKVPVWKALNEEDEQQGGEGLERYRAIATLSFFF